MQKKPLYIQILIRLAFLIVPIVALYFLAVFDYDPHKKCIGDEHRHTMGPWFGFVIFSSFIAGIWLLAIVIELIYNKLNNKKVANWLIFLVVMATLITLFFI